MDQNLHSKQTFKQNSRIISTDESLKQFIQNQTNSIYFALAS